MNNEKYLAVMCDVSRCGVLKVEEVKRFMNYIKKMGYNAMELYAEDTYALKDYPMFGLYRGGYTQEELKELDAYGRSIGIELVPCIQTLAHFTAMCKSWWWKGMFDIEDILLIDEPKVYDLIEAIFKNCAECFTSRRINIGMDEAYNVGRGLYQEKHGFVKDRASLLLKHLNKVSEIAKKYGFTCHMWSDMFVKLITGGDQYYRDDLGDFEFDPETLKKIPDNIELTYWDYYNDNPAIYNSEFKFHKKICKNPYFAGGAWTWVGFAPLNKMTIKNMQVAFKAAHENEINNLIVTMWGDDGQEGSFYSVLPSLFVISQFVNGNYDMEDIKIKFKETMGFDFDQFMTLDLINRIDLLPDTNCVYFTKPLLYNDPLLPINDASIKRWKMTDYQKAREKVLEASKQMGELSYLFELNASLCDLLSDKAWVGIALREAYKNNDKAALKDQITVLDRILVKFEDFKEKFYFRWNKENKPEGLDIHHIRFGGVKERLIYTRNKVQDYLDNKIDKIEELELDVPKFDDDSNFPYAQYRLNATANNL